MGEFPSLQTVDIIHLDELSSVLGKIDHTTKPDGIKIMRRYLMRKEKERTPADILKILKEHTHVASPTTIGYCMPTESSYRRIRYKFVRENERIIIFPDEKEDEDSGIMHIHFALADGMYLPDDAGLFTFHRIGILEVTGASGSLHIPWPNPARPATMEQLQSILPAGIELEGVPNSPRA